MTNNTAPTFSYFSQILDLPLRDNENNNKIGIVEDYIIELKEMYPRVVALIVRKRGGSFPVRIPWQCVKSIRERKLIIVGGYESFENAPVVMAQNEIRLREIFWDKQIVDTHGSKVVRVNDLHLLREKMSLWVIHVDIGVKGLLRRLGWLTFFNSLIKWLIGYEIRDKFIPWKFVHPIGAADQFKSLSITVPQSKLYELHPADLADIMVDLGTEERINILMSLDLPTAAKTFQELPGKIKMQIAEQIEMEELAKILIEMPKDEIVDFLSELRQETRNALYKIMPLEDVLQIRELLQHASYIAGSLMNTEFISVHGGVSVSDILGVIRQEADEFETIYYIYVVDKEEKIAGVLSLKQLLTADPNTVVSELMHTKVISVEVHTHVDLVAKIFFKYDFVVVPVIDEEDKLVGIITIKDALEAVFPEIREETEEIA